ncbi:hypothetical protein BGZ98_008929 [Dissophora globulifera]|nr:hypothetical protein BGZ98_008929 [Dissophora globulifera]
MSIDSRQAAQRRMRPTLSCPVLAPSEQCIACRCNAAFPCHCTPSPIHPISVLARSICPDPTPASHPHRVRRLLHFNSSIRATTNDISNDGGARDFGLNATTIHTNTTTKAYTTITNVGTNKIATHIKDNTSDTDSSKLMDLLGCDSPWNTISVSLLRYLKKKWLELKRGRIANSLSVPITFVKIVTLNAAVNSYLIALWTVLINSRFVEIKGSAFKMFKKEDPIQLNCTDQPQSVWLKYQLSQLKLGRWRLNAPRRKYDQQVVFVDRPPMAYSNITLPMACSAIYVTIHIQQIVHSTYVRGLSVAPVTAAAGVAKLLGITGTTVSFNTISLEWWREQWWRVYVRGRESCGRRVDTTDSIHAVQVADSVEAITETIR